MGLAALYHTWAAADPLFAEVAEKYPGVRILRQDPVENVFSFICSANNHISRISSMVESLCTEWGESLACYEGKEYFAFPPIEKLAEEGVEARLRELGFGYRAKYIQQSAARFNQSNLFCSRLNITSRLRLSVGFSKLLTPLFIG